MTKLIHPGLLRRRYHGHFRSMERFADDCRTGDLPAYTFIQPRLIVNHNDMHPPVSLVRKVHSSLLAGELLINDVYNAVRTGKNWLRTLLVVTFDEHGGCYDHWPPPASAMPPVAHPPYELEKNFSFDRFGVRVPTIFVSPRIAPGTVIRASGETPFDHTSMIKTICRRWDLNGLTDRDRAAPDFGSVFNLPESEARDATPELNPRPYTPISVKEAHGSLLSTFQKALGHLFAHHKGVEPPHHAETVGDLVSHFGDDAGSEG
jgi:phospholipase C